MSEQTFPLVFGLDTFGDLTSENGRPSTHAQTIRDVVEQGVLAEEVGLDFFGIGEHHTDDFPMPAADVALAAIAARTNRIHVGSAVTVLSSDDPVRVFQRFSTLNAISSGRAEVVLGRGSSIESFPLFGYDLTDYEQLFEEKTALFAEIMKGGPVTWHGSMRPSLENQDIVPHLDAPLPVWIGVGGSPHSVLRAARHGFNLMLAIIGGQPARFAPFSQLFVQALAKLGKPTLPIGVHSPGHVAETDERAREEFWPAYRDIIARLGPSRGFPPPTPEFFDREVGPRGALYVGSSKTVAEKIARNLPILHANRFDLKHGMPGMSQTSMLKSIELFGTEVVPQAKALLADQVAVLAG